jgi:hypothetical protein
MRARVSILQMRGSPPLGFAAIGSGWFAVMSADGNSLSEPGHTFRSAESSMRDRGGYGRYNCGEPGKVLVTTAGQRPGLSSLLVQRRLRRVTRSGVVLDTSGAVRSLRVSPSGLDTELSHAVDVAAIQQRPLVAVLPLPLPAALMAMAAAVTIAAIAAAGRVQARTAVVCPRLAGRQVYEELLVERERLSVLVPRALVGEASTSSTVVTAHDGAPVAGSGVAGCSHRAGT